MYIPVDAATQGAETAETPEIAETPIEEVTNALYEKSVKFAITHDVELKLPDILFDGATFRISPRSLEGNGMVAKLELIPRQQIEARLAGKILFKKIRKKNAFVILINIVFSYCFSCSSLAFSQQRNSCKANYCCRS